MVNHSPYKNKPSPWSSHSLIKKFLLNLTDGSRVLDVGTATGILARLCPEKNLAFYGIEPNSDWAKIAWPDYQNIFVGFVEEAPPEYLENYQAVLLADVLEHMPAPETVLKKLVERQTSECVFVISIPNIANFVVRLSLLVGQFDYTDRGILDRTHLRFFTRRTLIEMVNRCGLKIESIQATPIPLELVSPFFNNPIGYFLYKALAQITKMLPSLLGYQFVIKARKL
jgi:2-polyprenyl-3-methyl-5-hydroxy-6-metoxy-1,4-benzoquinol methylase